MNRRFTMSPYDILRHDESESAFWMSDSGYYTALYDIKLELVAEGLPEASITIQKMPFDRKCYSRLIIGTEADSAIEAMLARRHEASKKQQASEVEAWNKKCLEVAAGVERDRLALIAAGIDPEEEVWP